MKRDPCVPRASEAGATSDTRDDRKSGVQVQVSRVGASSSAVHGSHSDKHSPGLCAAAPPKKTVPVAPALVQVPALRGL